MHFQSDRSYQNKLLISMQLEKTFAVLLFENVHFLLNIKDKNWIFSWLLHVTAHKQINILCIFSEETGRQLGKICQCHISAAIWVSEWRLQEGSETRERLEDVHYSGHWPNGLFHPQCGELWCTNEKVQSWLL